MSGGYQPKPSVTGLRNPPTSGSSAQHPVKKIVIEVIIKKEK